MSYLWHSPVRTSRSWPNRRRVRPAVEALEDRTVPATFVVNNLVDGAGSLPEAIARANTVPGADTIVFDPSVRGGTVVLSFFNNPSSRTLDVPEPAGPSALYITSPITILGSGETIARAANTAAFRLFQVTGDGDLTLENLTLANGIARGGAGGGGGGGAAGLGGAIYNQGALTILGCTLTNNQAIGGASGSGGFGGGGGLGGPGDPSGPGGPPNGGSPNVLTAGFGGGGLGGTLNGLIGYGGFGGGGGASDSGGFASGFGGGGGADGGTGGPGSFGGFGGNFGRGGIGFGGGGSGLGGAIFNQGGTVTLANSTIAGNSAQGGDTPDGDPFPAQQGGAYGGGLFNLNGTVVLTNDTIAGNIVQAGTGGVANNALGGALYSASVNVGTATANQNSTITIANCILTSAGPGSTLHNYQDTPANPAVLDATGPNIVLGLVANHNGTVSGTPFENVDPLLGPLTNNGGPTPTMALLPSSPAIDAGNNAAASAAGLTTDQRGFGPRVVNGVPDLGAFETGAVPPGVVPPPVVPARAIVASLVNEVVFSQKKGAHGRRLARLFVRVSFADTGALKSEFLSPFQRPVYRPVSVTVFDGDGDGVADSVLLVFLHHGRKKALLRIAV
jgi:hypothetical protein